MTSTHSDTTPERRADSSGEKRLLRPHGKPSRASLRESINAKCKECIFDPLSGCGNWRQQVTACTSRTCPLYPVRPLSEMDKEGTA